MRAGAYSPNHIGNDAAIFNIAAEELRKRGCEVNTYTEEQFIAGAATEDIIVNMCRERRSIELLQKREDEGALVINSGYGIENCTRERMTRILLGSGIPYPESLMVNTDEAVVSQLEQHGFDRCWIKRGDFHAMHKEDVSYVRHATEAQEVLQEYFLRGIPRAVINRHLEGDLVKFYGVAGTDFFYWFYPLESGHSKFGAETINGMPTYQAFDAEALRETCQQAADAVGVDISGGACIVGQAGQYTLIADHAMPSIHPGRKDAGLVIARHIMNRIKDWQKH